VTSLHLTSGNDHWQFLVPVDDGILDESLTTEREHVIELPWCPKAWSTYAAKPKDLSLMHVIWKLVYRSSWSQ
jgi:hypothetical protein